MGSLLLRLTVETAHAFGYAVLAPGVVEPVEAAALAAVGCELGYGPLFDEEPITVPTATPASPAR